MRVMMVLCRCILCTLASKPDNRSSWNTSYGVQAWVNNGSWLLTLECPCNNYRMTVIIFWLTCGTIDDWPKLTIDYSFDMLFVVWLWNGIFSNTNCDCDFTCVNVTHQHRHRRTHTRSCIHNRKEPSKKLDIVIQNNSDICKQTHTIPWFQYNKPDLHVLVQLPHTLKTHRAHIVGGGVKQCTLCFVQLSFG